MSASSQATRPRRHRWRWIAVLLLGTLAGGVWFAPAIVSQTSLRHSIASWVTRGWPIRVEPGPTSLGWMKPVTLRDLRVHDADGQPLLTIKELRSEKTLWQLATQPTQFGTFTLVDPIANVVLRAMDRTLRTSWPRF